MRHPITVIWLVLVFAAACVGCELTITRLKYGGGGDWYAGPSMLPNLVSAVGKHTRLPVCDTVAVTEIMDERLFHHPFLFMTGHGNVRFTPQERVRLRTFLERGGFLWADDNYGMDKSFRREMQALFPQNPLKALPSTHPIYRSRFSLPGMPKIHEHDGAPALGYGIFIDERMVVFYSYSTDIGNGMEDTHVHNLPPALHETALRMGVNVVAWFFGQ